MVAFGKMLLMSAVVIGVGLTFLCPSSLAKKQKEKPEIGVCKGCYNQNRDMLLPFIVNPCATVKIEGCKDSKKSSRCSQLTLKPQPIETCPYNLTASYTRGDEDITVEISNIGRVQFGEYNHYVEARVVDENKNVLNTRVGDFRLFGRKQYNIEYSLCNMEYVCCGNSNVIDVAAYKGTTKPKYVWFSESHRNKNISIQFSATIIDHIRGSDVRYWTNVITDTIPYYSCSPSRNKECEKLKKSEQCISY